jgi:hypothetical protein
MVPSLSMNSLMNTSKLVDADYVTVFTKEEVQVFDAETAKFLSNHKTVESISCQISQISTQTRGS